MARSRWRWWLLQLARRIWFRAALFAMLSIASALVAIVLSPLIPQDLSSKVGADAVGQILQILASSMLVVATFSLSTMISAYAAASTSTTPRVTELLMQDASAQNALSTFVGAFLFALVGIIGLSAGVYGASGHVILFAVTLLVVLVIVVTFLRWVELLSNFGRIPDAIDRTEAAAVDAITAWLAEPHFGGKPIGEAPETPHEVGSTKLGYVRHIDVGRLQEIAEEADGRIRVTATPGVFLRGSRPLARADFDPTDEQRAAICAAFDIGDSRTFDQDAGYGVSALAEIGVKALSPGVNDPVTAVRVIDRIVKVLACLARRPDPEAPRFDRVYAPGLDTRLLFENAFEGLSQHGSGDVTVAVRIQEALKSLAAMNDAKCREAAREQASIALARAEDALTVEHDLARVRRVAREPDTA